MARPGRIALLALLVALPGALGCGGANAPCPTPTTEIDRLRDDSERLGRELDRATGEERAVRAKRTEAARRVEASLAALDSLRLEPTP